MKANVPNTGDSAAHRHADDGTPDDVHCHVWAGSTSRRPLVTVQLEAGLLYARADLTPAAARALAGRLLEAAASAEKGLRR